MLKAHMHPCQHLQISRQMSTHAQSTKQIDTHTQTHTQGLPSVCADHLWGYIHIHKPPFLLSLFSIILLRVQRQGLYFQTKHRPNSANPTPSPPSPHHSLVSFSLFSPLPLSRSFWSVFEEGTSCWPLWKILKKRPDKDREWSLSREGEEKWMGGKRRLGEKGNYDFEEGSSAKADGCRVNDGTTIERLLALFHRPPFRWSLWCLI